MSPIFNDCAFAPVDEAVIDMVLKMVSETAFDPIQLRLLSLPLQHGAGYWNAADFSDSAFCVACRASKVCGVLPRVLSYNPFCQRGYIRSACGSANVPAVMLQAMVHGATDSFADLHSRSTQRGPHDDQLDGFVMSVDGLVDIATKFQQRCSLLLGTVSVTAITGMLSPARG